MDIKRLMRAISRSNEALQRPRVNRRLILEQYVGHNYSKNGSPAPVPLNAVSLFIQTAQRALVPRSPQILIQTKVREAMPKIAGIERWVNEELERRNIESVLSKWAVDALTSVGFLKVALAKPSESQRSGYRLKAGRFFIERVSLDDMVFDPGATDFDYVTWIGHRFRAPVEGIREDTNYNKNRKNVAATIRKTYTHGGSSRADAISNDNVSEDDDAVPMTDLYEIYCPLENKVYTFADTSFGELDENQLIGETDWIGPDCGPYHVLGLFWVPDQIMPKAPVQDIIDMHNFTNEGVRKAFDQNARLRKLMLVQSDADAKTYEQTRDGEIIPTNNPDGAKEVVIGGIDPKLHAAVAWGWDMAKQLGGNLDATAGLGPNAKTASQDKMLTETASGSLASMAMTMQAACSRVLKAVVWYAFHDPDLMMTTKLPLPELNMQDTVTPIDRTKIVWDELDIRVNPYSMQYITPQQKAQALDQLMMNILIPMTPILAQSGIEVSIKEFLKIKAKYLDLPEILDITQIVDLPTNATPGASAQGGAEAAQPMSPQSSERRYVRENISERTNRGDTQNLVNSLMGVDTGGDWRPQQ